MFLRRGSIKKEKIYLTSNVNNCTFMHFTLQLFRAMSLNTKQDDDSKKRPFPLPVLTAPDQDKSLRASRVFGILFFILVLGAILFLVYTYDLFNIRRIAKPTEATNQRNQQTNQAPAILTGKDSTAVPPPQPVARDSSQSTPVMHEKTQYSIYIGSYPERVDAENEVSRWREAGYDSFVYDIPGWSRVALGHFESIADTKPMVDSLEQAFEQGYWVGPS